MQSASSVWLILIVLILAALTAYAVLTVRRARREHKARSDERAAAMLLALQGATNTRTAGPRAAPAAAAALSPFHNPGGVQPAPASMPASAPAELVRRARLLTDTQRLLYLVLRSALPDHVVMANVRIADLADVPADPAIAERDPRLHALARERIDCIVCSNDLVPVAACVIYETGIGAAPDERVKIDALREMGVKFLRFRADSLPRPAEMRALLLG